jgi:hypothetical protein
MSVRFPITRRQYLDWLDEYPRARTGTIQAAVREITGAEPPHICGVEWFCPKKENHPVWVSKFAGLIDQSSWARTRGQIKEALRV